VTNLPGLSFLRSPKTSTPPNLNSNESICRKLIKHGLVSKGKFIKGEDPMFNYCVLRGRVITDPTLRFQGKDNPVTEFTLQISMENRRCGTIKVSTFSSLAMGAAKHLRMGDMVVVAGFISGDVLRQEIRLAASDLAPLREDPDIE
jgi:hypothetical protein